MLFSTPRARTGFISYSAAFVVPSLACVMLVGWRADGNLTKIIRVILLMMVICLIVASATLLYAICENWDWKMSI